MTIKALKETLFRPNRKKGELILSPCLKPQACAACSCTFYDFLRPTATKESSGSDIGNSICPIAERKDIFKILLKDGPETATTTPTPYFLC